MADLAITAAFVEAGGKGAEVSHGICGETMTAGQAVYLDSATQRFKKARANAGTTDDVVGIALHNAEDGQPLAYLTRGPLLINAVAVPGTVFVLSAANAGGIAPVSDGAAGNFVTLVGIATTSSLLEIQIQVSGVQKP
jgi:hypothetical protein